MKLPESLNQVQTFAAEKGIVIPVILWWLGVPLVVVLILWLLVF